jgi:hypothetical protein
MKLFLLVIGLFIAAATLGEGASKTGKLVGHVDIGPLTPVERPGVKKKVPPEMYKQYTVQVTQPGPHNSHMKSHLIKIVATLKLSANGDFSTNLAPGTYDVRISSTKPMFRTLAPQEVKIVAGKTTRADIEIDTGIR